MIDAAKAEYDRIMNLPPDTGMFIVKPANTWSYEASLRPIPQMLYDELWYEGELCILFADTNTGKSILAVQIADSISRGVPIEGFTMTAAAQPVIYFDFELFDKQFELRYSADYQQHYTFADKLLRAEIDPDMCVPDGYDCMEDYLHDSIATTVMTTGARVLIIDNITYLRQETEKAKDALPLMKHLKELKKRYGLSILALAHTPKRDASKPLNRNDLQGSKMLMTFCDSSFCIGESATDRTLRYLKQIKTRAKEFRYHERNVALCRIEKPHNFLRFTLTGFGEEGEHLRDSEDRDREWLVRECKRLAEECPLLTQRDIAMELGISVSSVNKYLHM
ncbi:LuxR family transcriptional regulator [Chitinophagaceae bacterium IBVUCB1]|nr:LuxR family transcriptional regulator [Chitinophagaceae bacterium IBVUCB1]